MTSRNAPVIPLLASEITSCAATAELLEYFLFGIRSFGPKEEEMLAGCVNVLKHRLYALAAVCDPSIGIPERCTEVTHDRQ